MTLPLVSFPTLGWDVIVWMQEYLVHGPGDVQGDPVEIDDEIAVHLCWLYRVWPEDHPFAGRRLIQRGIFSRPKGRAKSELAGMLVCAEALGPVRCDGFDASGDPVGRPVRYPFIRCLATEEEQSGNTYDNVAYMLREGEVANAYAIDVGLTRTFIKEPSGGEITPSTASSSAKDGGKETFVVADETHLYAPKELRAMYRTVARNTGKRKDAEPWMFDTTTAWQPGEHSVAEQAADRYAHISPEEAVTKNGVLYDHRQGTEPKRFGDDRSLIKAMREGYGPAAEWMDFRRIVRIIRDAEDPEAEAYRFWLNRPRAAASHWLAPDEIQAVLRPETIVERGQAITAGFDGSLSDDHTVLWGCTEAGHLFPIGIWAAQEHQAEWEVPRQDVRDAVGWMFENFRVVRFNCDPPWWQDEVGQWAAEHSDDSRSQTLPVVEWWTNRDTPMAVACGALRTAIRKHDATIDAMPLRTDPQTRTGKPLAVWHFENARTRKVRIKLEDRAEEAHVVRKERPGSAKKIDSVVGAVLAYKARNDAVKEGEFVVEPASERAVW